MPKNYHAPRITGSSAPRTHETQYALSEATGCGPSPSATETLARAAAPITVRLLTVKDVAEALQLSTRTVRRMVTANQIPIIRLGRSVRVHPSAIYDLYNDIGK